MKAFVYARFSSDNQREESIDAQLRAIREYCDKNDIEIIREYTDEARSATSDKRPSFQQMFTDLQNCKPDAVIVHKLDRFSRDRYDSAFYRRILKKNGAKLISVLEPLDDSPESVILESVLEGMAEYYSKNLARETLKGLKETAYKCQHTGGVPPLGYDVDKTTKHYVINPIEAKLVVKIFNDYADGKSYDAILTELKDKKTKLGKPFGKNSLNSILSNEKYRGVYIFGLQKKSLHNSHLKQTDPIRIEGGMPRIIEDDLWYRVQERMSKKKRNMSFRAKRIYLLSGKLVCPKCGAIMSGNTSINKKGYEWSYYACTNKQRTKTCDQPNIPAEPIEKAVVDMVTEKMKPTDETVKYFMKILNRESPEAETYKEKLREIESKEDKIITAIENGADVKPLVARLKDLEAEAEELRKSIENCKSAEADMASVREWLEFLTDIRTKPRERQKVIIQRAVNKIKISDTQHIDVEYRIRMVAGDRNGSYALFTLPATYNTGRTRS